MDSFTRLKQEKLEDLISDVELTNEEIELIRSNLNRYNILVKGYLQSKKYDEETEMKLDEILDNIQSYIREKNSIHRK